jgi:hypothetical protein
MKWIAMLIACLGVTSCVKKDSNTTKAIFYYKAGIITLMLSNPHEVTDTLRNQISTYDIGLVPMNSNSLTNQQSIVLNDWAPAGDYSSLVVTYLPTEPLIGELLFSGIDRTGYWAMYRVNAALGKRQVFYIKDTVTGHTAQYIYADSLSCIKVRHEDGSSLPGLAAAFNYYVLHTGRRPYYTAMER